MSYVVVVGAGPAGMMAAIAAAQEGHTVTLIEKNDKLGKKLFITGKGRCNITNSCERDELLKNVVRNPKFLYSAFYQFDNQDIIRFFEESGCRLKEERGGRIFPVSDHSSDVIKALSKRLNSDSRIKVELQKEVKEILISEDTQEKKAVGVILKGGDRIHSDKVILATGGVSYPLTGSTGDGYKMARLAGHTVIEPIPSLVPLEMKEEWCRKLQGLSLKNVSLKLQSGKKTIFEGFGEMLFTHFGLSGPLILTASSYYVQKYYNMPASITIDLKPALTAEQLDKRILRDFEENSNKQFKNALDKLLPSKLIPVIISLSQIQETKKINEVTKEERKRLVELLKQFSMTVIGTRDISEAIITQGGINVKELNSSTMESRLVKNLYFAGEILDVNALTGGYNLQIAWSSGYLAGSSI